MARSWCSSSLLTLCLVSAISTHAAGATRTLQDDDDPLCVAFGSLQIVSTEGKCSGEVSASCEAVVAQQKVLEGIFNDLLKSDFCEDKVLRRASSAVAGAVASVWSASFASVECESGSKGFGCGYAASGPGIQAWAKNFAASLQSALSSAVEASKKSNKSLRKLCVDEILTLDEVLGDSAEDGVVRVCSEEGKKSNFERIYTRLVRGDILEALEKVTSTVCDPDEAPQCMSEKGKGAGKKRSVSRSAETSIEICKDENVISRCCTPEAMGRNFCVCSMCANPLTNEGLDDEVATWKDALGEACICP